MSMHSDPDDVENGRVTPKRTNYNDSPVAVAMASANQKVNLVTETEQALESFFKSETPIHTGLSIDALLASISSCPNVLIKDEPSDCENLHSDGPKEVVSSPLCTLKSEESYISPEEGTENCTYTNNKENLVKPAITASPIDTDTCQAHPQISLVPTHRLRVKAEFTETSSPSKDINTEIAKDLYEGQNLLPENFFDDLLVDRVQERVDEAENEELEEKYSDRLKILQQLEGRTYSKEKKKHKKSKKKSRKRSRSRSRDRGGQSAAKVLRTYRALEEDTEMASTSKRSRSCKTKDQSKINDIDDDSKKGNPLMDLEEEARVSTENYETIEPHLPEIGPHLTARQKRDRILIRAKVLISYLKRVENSEELPFTRFVHTSTVRKLPASYSYRHQHIYENRSPLHTINNVKYKFNSHISEFNFEEWGLASLPPLSSKMAKLVSYDAATLHNKLKNIKIPAKLRNIKSEDQMNEEEELLRQTRLSLYCTVTTQTDETVEFNYRKPKGYDIGVQCKPLSLEMASQTLETEAPSIKKFDNEDELPIMAIMRQLNENQLMALHDFAELLMEPTTNAMDMYRLRQRMLEIYKSSQMPSALPPLISVPGNSYTSNECSSSSLRYQKQQHKKPQDNNSAFRIETVSSADGRRIMINDSPRQRNTEEVTNAVNRNVRPISRLNRTFNPMPSSSSYLNFQNQQQQNQPPTNIGNKYYGRGGLRR